MNGTQYIGRPNGSGVSIGTATLCCVLVAGLGCSHNGSGSAWGGKPINLEEYARLTKDQAPRQAYLAWKAQQQNRPLAEVEAADASLSISRNPFSSSDGHAVAMGRTMYLAHCAICHGVDADGHGPLAMPNSDRMSFHNSHKRAYIALFGHAPENWYPSIAHGPAGNAKLTKDSAKMPTFENTLSREQIWLLVTYLEQETLHPNQSSTTK